MTNQVGAELKALSTKERLRRAKLAAEALRKSGRAQKIGCGLPPSTRTGEKA